MDFLPFGKRTKTGLLYPNKSRRQLALHCVFFHRTKLEASFRWIFCLSAKEPKRGPCTQTKAVGSWRCTASFYIEPSWKQASAWFYVKSRAPLGVRLFVVSHTGFEPVTSALSRQRSKPTELMALTVLSTNILT